MTLFLNCNLLSHLGIVPMDRKFGSLFFQRKASCDRVALPNRIINYQPSVSTLVFSCDHTTCWKAYYFTTDGYGIFNVRRNLGACRTHEGRPVANKSAKELTRTDVQTTVPRPAPPGDRTRGLRICILDLDWIR